MKGEAAWDRFGDILWYMRRSRERYEEQEMEDPMKEGSEGRLTAAKENICLYPKWGELHMTCAEKKHHLLPSPTYCFSTRDGDLQRQNRFAALRGFQFGDQEGEGGRGRWRGDGVLLLLWCLSEEGRGRGEKLCICCVRVGGGGKILLLFVAWEHAIEDEVTQ